MTIPEHMPKGGHRMVCAGQCGLLPMDDLTMSERISPPSFAARMRLQDCYVFQDLRWDTVGIESRWPERKVHGHISPQKTGSDC